MSVSMSGYRAPQRRSSMSDRFLYRDKLINKFKDSKYYDPKTCAISRLVDSFPHPPEQLASGQRKLKISAPSLQASSNPMTTQYTTYRGSYASHHEPEPAMAPALLPRRDIYENKNTADLSDATYSVCRGILLKRLEAFQPEDNLAAKPLEVVVPDTEWPESATVQIETVSPDPLAGYSLEPDEETLWDDDEESFYGDETTTPEDQPLMHSPLKCRLSTSFSIPYAPWPPTPMPADREQKEMSLYDTLLIECKRPATSHTQTMSFASTLVDSRPVSSASSKQFDEGLRPPLLRNPASTASTGSCALLPSPGLPLSSSPCPTYSSAPAALTYPPVRSPLSNAASPTPTFASAPTAFGSPSRQFTSPPPLFTTPPPPCSPGFKPPPDGYVLPSPPDTPYSVHPLLRQQSSSGYTEFGGNPYRMSQMTQWTDDDAWSPEPLSATDSINGDEEKHFSVLGALPSGPAPTQASRRMKSIRRGPSSGLRRQNARGKVASGVGTGGLHRSDTGMTFLQYYGVEKTKELPPIPQIPAQYAQQGYAQQPYARPKMVRQRSDRWGSA